jgi:hypothetical protein
VTNKMHKCRKWTLIVAAGVFLLASCRTRPESSAVREMHSTSSPQGSTVRDLISHIKQTYLKSVDTQDLRKRMIDHLVILGLANPDGKVKIIYQFPDRSPADVELLKTKILPAEISLAEVDEYLEKLVSANSQNPYLVNFLSTAAISPALLAKIEAEGHSVFPDLLAYGMLLENLSKLLREDVEFLKYCRIIMDLKLRTTGATKYFNEFEKIKIPVLNKFGDEYVLYQQKGEVPFSLGYDVLSENIMVAAEWDKRWGNEANFEVGRVLCSNPAGWSDSWLPNGAGPTVIAPDRVGMLFSPPNPQEWADLYTVWNLGFVSSYENWPYFFMKLITPFVAEHVKNPTEFMHRRGMALFLHANFALIGRPLKSDSSKVAWGSKKLYMDFGAANLRYSRNYLAGVESTSRGSKISLAAPKICDKTDFERVERTWTFSDFN